MIKQVWFNFLIEQKVQIRIGECLIARGDTSIEYAYLNGWFVIGPGNCFWFEFEEGLRKAFFI